MSILCGYQVTQLTNQRIINLVKINYRKMALQSLLISVDSIFNVEKLANNITVLDEIYWLPKSVNLIKPDTVKNISVKLG